MSAKSEIALELTKAFNSFSNPVWFEVHETLPTGPRGAGYAVRCIPMIGRTIDESDKTAIKTFHHVDPLWVMAWIVNQLIRAHVERR